MSAAFVLFGVGSSLVVEYEESCLRLGHTIAAAISNRPGRIWSNPDHRTFESNALSSEIVRTPCLCPIFTPSNRRMAVIEAAEAGFTFANALIDPTAIVSRSSSFGSGGFVNAGCVVGAETHCGDHVVINRGVSVGHHVSIGDFASIGPSAVICGHVILEPDAMVGAGAVVMPAVRIGAGAVVAAGAVVVSDVAPGARMFGNAARPRVDVKR